MHRRTGITLIEVLVAIFVAAIGTLSLLVLFPLGALNMAQAIRDDRCAQSAIDGAALADAGEWTAGPSPATGVYSYRTDPRLRHPQVRRQGGMGLSASFPVYIDAIAVNILGSSAGVGGLGATAPATSIARVAPSTVTTSLLTYRRFRLQDDMAFNSNGMADTSAGSFVNRGGRYTWAYTG